MRLLLDTCTFLWTLSGVPALPPGVHRLIRDADNDVFLSVASAWEIWLKHGARKLTLPDHPDRYIPAMRAERGIATLPIDEESVLHASRLAWLHRDPFDRLLVAQAIVHGMTILTPDPIIARYPARTMW